MTPLTIPERAPTRPVRARLSPTPPMPDGRDPFPYARHLSLAPLVERWRARVRQASASASVKPLAADLGALLDATPELEAPDLSAAAVAAHAPLVRMLASTLVPAEGLAAFEAAVTAPYRTDVLHATPGFEALGLWAHADAALERLFARHATAEILRQAYGLALPRAPRTERIADAETGLTRYFRVMLDPRFVRVEPLAQTLPSLDAAEADAVFDDVGALDQLTARFAGAFAFRGLMLVTAEDATESEARAALGLDLLRQSAMATEADVLRLQEHVRTILWRPDIALGLVGVERGNRYRGVEAITGARPVGRSLLLGDAALDPAEAEACRSAYTQTLLTSTIVVVDDLADCDPCSPHERRLLDAGYRSLMLVPLREDRRLVGLLELGSPRPGAFTPALRRATVELGVVFSTAMKRAADEEENRIQAVIKHRFTAVHPSVEWRFRQEAQRVLAEGGVGRRRTAPIVFHDVFGLYGLTDIRDSSNARLEAIGADLDLQTQLAEAVLDAALDVRPLPALREKRHRLQVLRGSALEGIRVEHETDVLSFLRDEIEPLFATVHGWSAAAGEAAAAYRRALDRDLGFLYRRRRGYEQSVTAINETVARVLEVAQEDAQRIVPHYFERYKSDGVEHNLYAGEAIVEDGGFDRLHLESLRLWQLETICRVAREVEAIKPHLPLPLETVHLVLVQGSPFDVRFRQDEKRFDVDGAYNARYEIMKKRIDKACIVEPEALRGQRVTQPQTLSVVYASIADEMEYRRYLGYLAAEGWIEADVEALELEDLPGVHGLRALRVRIALPREDNEMPELVVAVPADVAPVPASLPAPAPAEPASGDGVAAEPTLTPPAR